MCWYSRQPHTYLAAACRAVVPQASVRLTLAPCCSSSFKAAKWPPVKHSKTYTLDVSGCFCLATPRKKEKENFRASDASQCHFFLQSWQKSNATSVLRHVPLKRQECSFKTLDRRLNKVYICNAQGTGMELDPCSLTNNSSNYVGGCYC